MKNGILQEAQQHIIERPAYLDEASSKGKTLKYRKMAETLKILDASKCLQYDVNEFEREFGDKPWHKTAILTNLRKLGLKPRLVADNGKVFIWSTKV